MAIGCFTPNASVQIKSGAPFAVPMNAFDIQRGVRTRQRGHEYEGFLTSNGSMLSLALLVMVAMLGPDMTTVATCVASGESPDPRLPRVRVVFEDVSHVASASEALNRFTPSSSVHIVFDTLRAAELP